MSILKTMKSCTRASLNFSSQMYRAMTSSGRLLPDFLIIGGQRCGTSSLYYYLTDHPDIISASTKETHFFDECFAKGLPGIKHNFPHLHTKCMREMYSSRILLLEKEHPITFCIHTPLK